MKDKTIEEKNHRIHNDDSWELLRNPTSKHVSSTVQQSSAHGTTTIGFLTKIVRHVDCLIEWAIVLYLRRRDL